MTLRLTTNQGGSRLFVACVFDARLSAFLEAKKFLLTTFFLNRIWYESSRITTLDEVRKVRLTVRVRSWAHIDHHRDRVRDIFLLREGRLSDQRFGGQGSSRFLSLKLKQSRPYLRLIAEIWLTLSVCHRGIYRVGCFWVGTFVLQVIFGTWSVTTSG